MKDRRNWWIEVTQEVKVIAGSTSSQRLFRPIGDAGGRRTSLTLFAMQIEDLFIQDNKNSMIELYVSRSSLVGRVLTWLLRCQKLSFREV